MLKSLLAGAFSGTPDSLIDSSVKKIKEHGGFELEKMFKAIRDQRKTLKLEEDRFFQIGSGNKKPHIHLLFSIWYHNAAADSGALDSNNLPEIDHIFPDSSLKKVRKTNSKTDRQVMRYRAPERDQLANRMLLTKKENRHKSDTLPKDWFADKDECYLEKHLIPKDPSLWEIERFEDFISARKILLREKFQGMGLIDSSASQP